MKKTRTSLGTTEQAVKEKGRFSGLGGILKWSSRLQEVMALSVSDLASPISAIDAALCQCAAEFVAVKVVRRAG